jgi:hypothetical protein
MAIPAKTRERYRVRTCRIDQRVATAASGKPSGQIVVLAPGAVTFAFETSSSGPAENRLTAQGHPRTIFKRALEFGNLLIAEVTARELGSISLAEALELTARYPVKDPGRYPRVATRWLERYIDERPGRTVDEVALIFGALVALASAGHDAALASLRAVSQ